MNRMYDRRPDELVILSFRRLVIGARYLNSLPLQNFGFPVVEGQPTIVPRRLFAPDNPRQDAEKLLESGDIVIVDAERGALSIPLDMGDRAAAAAFRNAVHNREEVEA